MTTRKKNDPFDTLSTLHEQLHRLFAEDFQIQDLSSAWIPPVDIYESDDCYLLRAEVPGLDADSIKINVHQNQIQIGGERKLLFSGAEKYHLAEIPHGEFRRTFQFPVAIQSDKVKAELSDGILTVELPKEMTNDALRIEIS